MYRNPLELGTWKFPIGSVNNNVILWNLELGTWNLELENSPIISEPYRAAIRGARIF